MKKEDKPNSVPPTGWEDTFIAEYRETGNISHAARLSGVTRQGVYARREADAEFRAAMDDAREEATDSLELEAHRRAVRGTLKPVFYKGDEVGEIQEYSDTLLIVLLKANRPDKFKDRVSTEHSGPGGGPIPLSIDAALNKVYGDGISEPEQPH